MDSQFASQQKEKEIGSSHTFENNEKDKGASKKNLNEESGSSIKLKKEISKSSIEKKEDSVLLNQKNDQKDTSVLRQLLFKMKLRDQMKRVVERTFAGRSYHSKEYSHFLNDKASNFCRDQNRCLIDKMQNVYAKSNIQNVLKYNEQMQAKYKQELLQKKQKFAYIKERMINFLINFPVFPPSHRYKLFWDLLINVNCILIMFFLPISFLYGIPITILLGNLLKNLIPIALLLDLLVNLNTGFFSQGQISKSRSQIFLQFLKNNWFSDLIPLALFLINYINFPAIEDNSIAAKVIRLISFLFFARISQLLKVLHTVEDTASLNPRAVNIIQLFQVLILILFVSHLFASAWLFLGMNSSYSLVKQTWLNYRQIENSDWTVQYLQSYYFATVTMITVGYGDITPQNPQEMLFCVLSMMLCCGVFAYSINQIGNIFKQFFRFENELKENMKVINNYMRNKKVNSDLQYQVRQYLDYYWREESQQDMHQESRIINQLSDGLRETLLMEANKIALIDSPIFRDNFSNQVIAKTVPLIKEMRFTPEEIIFDEEKTDSLEGSIYFIEKGKVEICSYYAHPIVKKQQMINRIIELKSGDSFGQISFFTGKRRAFSVRSLEFCRLLVIRRNDFIQLLQEYPDDYEKFCMIKDDILMSNNTSRIETKCYACKATNHLITECHFAHFLPNKKRIILQESRGVNKNRVNQCRRKKSPYYDLSELMEGALQVLENCKETIIENYDYYYEDTSDENNDESKDEVLDKDHQLVPNNNFNNQRSLKRNASQNIYQTNNNKNGSSKFIKQETPINSDLQNNLDRHYGISETLNQEQNEAKSDICMNGLQQQQQQQQQPQPFTLDGNQMQSINNSSRAIPFIDSINHKPRMKMNRLPTKTHSSSSIKYHTNDEMQYGDQTFQQEQQSTDQTQYFSEKPQNLLMAQNSKQNLYPEEQSGHQYSTFYKYGQNISKPQANNVYLVLKQNPQFQIYSSNPQIPPSQQIISGCQKRSSIEKSFTFEPETYEQTIQRQQRKKMTLNINQQGLIMRSGSNIKSIYECSLYKDNAIFSTLVDGVNRNYQQTLDTPHAQLIMESLRNYTIYFPHNNASIVIKKFQNSRATKKGEELQKRGSLSQRQTVLKIINKVSDNLQILRKKSIFSMRQSTMNGDQSGVCSPQHIQRQLQNDISFNRSQSILSKQSKGTGQYSSKPAREKEKTHDSSLNCSHLSNELSISQTKQSIKLDLFNDKLTIHNTDQNLSRDQSNTFISRQEITQKNINVFNPNKKNALSDYNTDKI